MPLLTSKPSLVTCAIANASGLLWHIATLAVFASAANAYHAFCATFVLSVLLQVLAAKKISSLSPFATTIQLYLAILLLFHTYLSWHWHPGDNKVLHIVLLPLQCGVLIHCVTMIYAGILTFLHQVLGKFSAKGFAPATLLVLLFIAFELTPLPAILPASTSSWLSYKLMILHIALLSLFAVAQMTKMLGTQRQPNEVANP